METFVTMLVVGIIISLMGIINMTGNISSLHWYHRQRVTEETRKAFGKLMGLGTLIAGISIVVFGVFNFICEKTNLTVFSIIGTVAMTLGIVIGLVVSFYAMKKYNGGIF